LRTSSVSSIRPTFRQMKHGPCQQTMHPAGPGTVRELSPRGPCGGDPDASGLAGVVGCDRCWRMCHSPARTPPSGPAAERWWAPALAKATVVDSDEGTKFYLLSGFSL